MTKTLAILACLVVGSVAVGCSVYPTNGPERTLSLLNDTGGPRLVHRCHGIGDCRSPDEGELVQLGKSFDFDTYADEGRAYVVASSEGKTFGCIKVFIADSRPNPKSLSDLRLCPPGTPKAFERA